MRARLLLALVLASVLGCRSVALPPATTVPVVASPSETSSHDPDSIRWVRDAAEYRAVVLQTYRQATRYVERVAASRRAGSWAVVLDADETVISNLTYQVERARQGLPFTPESWHAWVMREEATPLPGAAAFLARVRGLGGRIAIVTNRRAAECPATVAVFRKYSLTHDAVLCRPDEGPSDKNPRFAAVTRGDGIAGSGPLDVIAFLGDNILDFPGLSQAAQDEPALAAFGERYFLVPNPMYGSWQR
jgi:5'-nucleotidase (lipoprotein e(P4) family)